MRNLGFSILFLLLGIGAACADVPVSPPLTKSCGFGFSTDSSGNPGPCQPAPSSVALPKSCAFGVATDSTGAPSGCVQQQSAACPWQVALLPASPSPHPLAAADNCLTQLWDSSVSMIVQIGSPTGFSSTFQACFQTGKTGGSINFSASAGVVIKGGSNSLPINSWACLQPAPGGIWSMIAGSLQTIANPNAN